MVARTVIVAQIGRENAGEIARMMVGNETPLSTRVEPRAPGEVLLDVSHLNYRTSDPFGTSLQDLCMSLRSGEIVGIAGVAGNGQDELLRALSGEALVSNDSITLNHADRYVECSHSYDEGL